MADHWRNDPTISAVSVGEGAVEPKMTAWGGNGSTGSGMSTKAVQDMEMGRGNSSRGIVGDQKILEGSGEAHLDQVQVKTASSLRRS